MRTTKAPSPERGASGLSGGRLWVLITSIMSSVPALSHKRVRRAMGS
jgi:hypothetical protein